MWELTLAVLLAAALPPGDTVAVSIEATPVSSPPVAGVVWFDDFERDLLASYFERSGWQRVAGAGRGGGYGLVASMVQGEVDVASLKLAFGRTPDPYIAPVDGGVNDYRAICYSFDVRVSEGFQSAPESKLTRAIVFGAPSWAEAAIAHLWPGPNPDLLRFDPARGTDEAGNLLTTSYNDGANLTWLGSSPVATSVYNGEWHKVEACIGLDEGTYEASIDGVREIDRRGLNWLGGFSDYGVNAVFMEQYWNNRAPAVQSIAIDNLTVRSP